MSGQKYQAVGRVVDIAGQLVLGIVSIVWLGIRSFRECHWWQIAITVYLLTLGFVFGYRFFHIRLLAEREFITLDTAQTLTIWGRLPHAFGLMACLCVVLLFLFGITQFKRRMQMNKLLARLNIKSGVDCKPLVIAVRKLDKQRSRLILASHGVGIDHYKNRASDIEAIFGAKIESIRTGKTPSFVEIALSYRTIPRVCHYHLMTADMTKSSGFIVGESLNGAIEKSVLDIAGAHLLIAGTTGGGKSNWFKSTLLSLIETTPYGEFYLMDFKGGVEFGPFKKFGNINVVKDMEGALRILRTVVDEMNRRFELLEKNERSEIDPERDKVNHVYVAVDEASLLFSKVDNTSGESKNVAEARRLTNDIGKRGRAARISLVLATQKITKETIDTSVQEVITGRMCFRVNTLQGSMIVLGNKAAMDLPDIPGRAIWQSGTEQIEVQAPLIREKDIQAAIKSPKQTNFFPLIGSKESIEQRGNNPYLEQNEAKKKG